MKIYFSLEPTNPLKMGEKLAIMNKIPFKANRNIMKKNQSYLRVFLIFCATALLVSACDIQISLGSAQSSSAAAATVTTGTGESGQVPVIKINLNGVAQGYSTLTVEAPSAGADIPYWDNLPAHTVTSLNGYVIQNHLHKPQLIIYPADELAKFNEGAGRQVDELRALLQNQQTGERMPFLPLFNAAQLMHTQVKYLDFANGKGVRFLTQFSQAPMPINNHDLFYSFQGLINDGKYYLAAVLPVNHASLPVDGIVNDKEMEAYINNFPAKMNEAMAAMNQQTANSFTPDLALLDAMMQSIVIQ